MKISDMRCLCFLLLTATLFPVTFLGQVDLLNRSLTKPHVNILYWGIPNEMEVIGLSPGSNIELTADDGETRITPQKSNDGILMVLPGKDSTVDLHVILESDTVLTKSYQIHRIPGYEIRLGQITDTTATVQEILDDPAFHVVIPNSFVKHDIKVVGFEAAVIRDSEIIPLLPLDPDEVHFDTIYTISPFTFEDTMLIEAKLGSEVIANRGNKLNARQLEFIKSLNAGDKIRFYVCALGTYACPTRCGTRTITIK